MPKTPPNPSLGKKREKKVKGYAVIWKYTNTIKSAERAERISDRNMSIYSLKRDAKHVASHSQYFTITDCTITYSIPCKKK